MNLFMAIAIFAILTAFISLGVKDIKLNADVCEQAGGVWFDADGELGICLSKAAIINIKGTK